MQSHVRLATLVNIVLLIFNNNVWAQSAIDFAGSDGVLDETEFITYYKHKKFTEGFVFASVDKNKDGHVDDEEFEAARKAWLQRDAELAEDAQGEFVQRASGRATISVEEADLSVAPPVGKPFNPLAAGGLQIRRDLSSVDATRLPDRNAANADWIAAQPALFSYLRDYSGGNDAVQAHGVIARPFRWGGGQTNAPTGLELGALALVPSLAFDRVRYKDSNDKNVNSLIVRLSGEPELRLPRGGLVAGLYPTLSLAYATDFELEAQIYGVEFELLPILDVIGYDVKQEIWPGAPLAFRWRVAGRSEAGYTADPGDSSRLEDNEGFLRIGPTIRLELLPELEYLSRLTGRIDYSYMRGFGGSPNGGHLVEATLALRLDETGYASVELNYRDGETPLVVDKTKTLTLGLGLKF